MKKFILFFFAFTLAVVDSFACELSDEPDIEHASCELNFTLSHDAIKEEGFYPLKRHDAYRSDPDDTSGTSILTLYVHDTLHIDLAKTHELSLPQERFVLSQKQCNQLIKVYTFFQISGQEFITKKTSGISLLEYGEIQEICMTAFDSCCMFTVALLCEYVEYNCFLCAIMTTNPCMRAAKDLDVKHGTKFFDYLNRIKNKEKTLYI